MNVLIADHHPVYRKGLKYVMKDYREIRFTGKVENGRDLLLTIDEQEPEMLILEIDLPNINGIGILRELNERYPNMRVLVISAHPEMIYAESAIKAGASGYISKTRNSKDIRRAILEVSKGNAYMSPEIEEYIKSRKNRSKHRVFKKLSTREIEVLNLISRGKRNKEISEILNINEKTVSTYKTRLLRKLNVTNVADLIHQSRLLQISK